MQEKIRQLAATASLQEGAQSRYLSVYNSPWTTAHMGGGLNQASQRLARPTSPGQRTPIIILRFIQSFWQFHSKVMSVGFQAGRAQRQAESPHECRRSRGEPLPPLDELIKIPADSLSPAPDAADLHTFSTPATLGACAAQEAARIPGHVDGSRLNSTAGVLGHRSGNHEVEAHVMGGDALNNVPAVLANSNLCQKMLFNQPGSMKRTMLACEGIAINSLFDHGRPTYRV
jgi:hypothetical protein